MRTEKRNIIAFCTVNWACQLADYFFYGLSITSSAHFEYPHTGGALIANAANM